MRKIPTVFKRNPDDMAHVLDEVHPDCTWVLEGLGTPRRKYDGTCVMFDGQEWWARREVKPGKPTPPNYQYVSTDLATGKIMGWEPIEQSPFVKAFREAVAPLTEFGQVIGAAGPPVGTYELIGPKINGNPEKCDVHRLQRHDTAEQFGDLESFRTYDGLRHFLTGLQSIGIEGIVWHDGPDGVMAKLKGKDFK